VSSTPGTEGSSGKVPLDYIAEKILQSMGELLVRDCANRDVAVSGSDSDIVLVGGCRSVTVSGSGNKILAEIVGGGELTVLRSRNSVAWATVGGSLGRVVVRAEPSNRTTELPKVAPGDGQPGKEIAP
jgi:hypothetical protein